MNVQKVFNSTVGVIGHVISLYAFTALIVFASDLNGLIEKQLPQLEISKFFPYDVDGGIEDESSPLVGHMKMDCFNQHDAILINFFLLAVWCGSHSMMARDAVKKKMNMLIPEYLMRSTYCIVAAAETLFVLENWKPITNVVMWDVANDSLEMVLTFACVAFWGLAVATTFVIDHFELFGSKQAYKNKKEPKGKLTKSYMYGFVRHPLMTFIIMGLWCTPLMTFGRFMLCVTFSLYIGFAVKFYEEPALVKKFGTQYKKYQNSVPMFCPHFSFIFNIGDNNNKNK